LQRNLPQRRRGAVVEIELGDVDDAVHRSISVAWASRP
jgi:hypothetical protein